MLNVLHSAHNLIVENFETYKWLSPDEWNSLDISYKDLHVERLWRQFGKYRIYLHKIHNLNNSFFHFHPWPAAMQVIHGSYVMEFGYGPRDEANPPKVTLKQILTEGACYSMEDPLCWHSVRPIGKTALSLMVTNEPFRLKEDKPKYIGVLPSFDRDKKLELLIEFNSFIK